MDLSSYFVFPISDPVLLFAMMMIIILAAPLITAKLRLPEITGLILAGILIGPHGLNIIERDSTIELLAAVGLLYIMFLAGLEIDLQQVKRNKKQSLGFGLLTFLVPLAMGTAMAYYLLEMPLASSILLASMFSSHTLITYPIVSKLGIAKNPTVTTSIGGTIITDTLAMIVLAVIASMAKGELSTAFWIRLVSLMVLYGAAMVFLIPRAGTLFFRNAPPDGTSEFVFVLAVVFISGFLAHLAGLEPIIGAFLAGLTLNNLIPEKGVLMNRIHFVGDSLFIPFFLVSVGMLVNINTLLTDRAAWLTAGLMAAVALISKWLAAETGGRLLRFSLAERFLMYGLSVNQAAATLAAVLVGYRLGLFSDSVLTGTIFMIIITCLAGSFITQAAGRKIARRDEQETAKAGPAPQRILLPLVNRDTASELVDLAILLRDKGSKEPMYPLVVAVEGSDSEQQLASGEKILASAVVRGAAVGLPVMPLTRVDINPASGIIHAARDMRISCIIAGWDAQPSKGRAVHGKVLDKVLSESPQLLAIAHFGHPINTVKRVLLVLPPYSDRQQGYLPSIKAVKVLASQIGARLTLVTEKQVHDLCLPSIKEIKPNTEMGFIGMENWKEVTKALAENYRDDDLLIVCSARTGEPAWQPSLNRLPGQIARDYRDNSFLFLYPPQVSFAEEQEPSLVSAALSSLLYRHRARFDLKGLSLSAAVRELIIQEFPPVSPEYIRLSEELSLAARTEPIELLPGIVLVHAHVPEVLKPTLFMGINREGFDLPGAENPKVVFLLLGREGDSPEIHLRTLSDLAKALRDKKTAAALLEAENWEDLLDRLK